MNPIWIKLYEEAKSVQNPREISGKIKRLLAIRSSGKLIAPISALPRR